MSGATGFLSLPLELRQEIYTYLLSYEYTRRPNPQALWHLRRYHWNFQLSLLRVNKQIGAEASQIMHQRNDFFVVMLDPLAWSELQKEKLAVFPCLSSAVHVPDVFFKAAVCLVPQQGYHEEPPHEDWQRMVVLRQELPNLCTELLAPRKRDVLMLSLWSLKIRLLGGTTPNPDQRGQSLRRDKARFLAICFLQWGMHVRMENASYEVADDPRHRDEFRTFMGANEGLNYVRVVDEISRIENQAGPDPRQHFQGLPELNAMNSVIKDAEQAMAEGHSKVALLDVARGQDLIESTIYKWACRSGYTSLVEMCISRFVTMLVRRAMCLLEMEDLHGAHHASQMAIDIDRRLNGAATQLRSGPWLDFVSVTNGIAMCGCNLIEDVERARAYYYRSVTWLCVSEPALAKADREQAVAICAKEGNKHIAEEFRALDERLIGELLWSLRSRALAELRDSVPI